MKKYIRVTALILLLSVLFTSLISCNKPEDIPSQGNEQSQNGDAKPPKTSIKELHYDNQKVRSNFYDYISLTGPMLLTSPEQGDPHNSTIDFESPHTYVPIDDVTVDVYYGWHKNEGEDIRAHELRIKNQEGKTISLNRVDDTYFSDKYFRDTVAEERDYGVKHNYVYSHSEKITIPAEMFSYGAGIISIVLYGIDENSESGEMTAKSLHTGFYYKTDGETVELNYSLLASYYGGTAIPLFLEYDKLDTFSTSTGGIESVESLKNFGLSASAKETKNFSDLGEIVCFDAAVYGGGAGTHYVENHYAFFVCFKGENGVNTVFEIDKMADASPGMLYSFTYSGDFSVEYNRENGRTRFYLWDDDAYVNVKLRVMDGWTFGIKSVKENDELRKLIDKPIEEQTEIEGYKFTLVKNPEGKYTRIIVTKPDGTQDVYGA
ncbi:MAG: hypothetical protein IKD45_02180 [Clostridia bacterium]|nr:hypothetical protein [Clostridia bacterium]